MKVLILTVLTLCVLGGLLAIVLYFVARKFKVEGGSSYRRCGEDASGRQLRRLRLRRLPCHGRGSGQAGRHFVALLSCRRCRRNEKGCRVVSGQGRTRKKGPEVATVRCGGVCSKRPKTNSFDGCEELRRGFVALCGRVGLRFRLSGLRRLRGGVPVRCH